MVYADTSRFMAASRRNPIVDEKNRIRQYFILCLCALVLHAASSAFVQAQNGTERMLWPASVGSGVEVLSHQSGTGVTTKPVLACSLDAPQIIADNMNLRYVPMPFTVTVTVTNAGDMLTDSVWARIVLPKDLELATPDIPDHHTKHILPAYLFPAQSGSTTWQVRHPNTDVDKSYVVTVWVKTKNADSSKCEISIVIPQLDSPILSPRCFVPDSLRFDENLDSYVPNPFTVRLTCVNNGNTKMFGAEGTIILPPDLEFDVPQPTTKSFTPADLDKYIPPAPAAELTWTVRWTKRYRSDTTAQIRWTVTGRRFTGEQMDSTEVRCRIASIPGLRPLYRCAGHMWPDSLGVNAAGTDVEPNPFTIRRTIKNVSKQTGGIKRSYISFPPDGLSLDPSSPDPMDQTMDLVLEKGESHTFEWLIKVQNRVTRRLPLFTMIAITDEGYEVRCEKYIPIANVRTLVGGDFLPLPVTTRLKQNHPNPFNPTTTIEYHLGEAGEYSLTLYDALGRMLRVLDSGYKPAGTYTYEFDATGLSSGVYLYKLETAGFTETKRMILSR
jgi:hypothetical protein